MKISRILKRLTSSKCIEELVLILLRQAMASMRILGEQLHLNKCSSSVNTRGVQVDVTSASSGWKVSPWNPGERVYDFSYRIRLANRG